MHSKEWVEKNCPWACGVPAGIDVSKIIADPLWLKIYGMTSSALSNDERKVAAYRALVMISRLQLDENRSIPWNAVLIVHAGVATRERVLSTLALLFN